MKHLILFFSLLFCMTAFAQRKNTPISLFEETEQEFKAKMVGTARNYVGLSIGFSLPDTKYGGITHSNNSGFAKNGWIFSADAAYLLFRNVGLAGTLTLYGNGIKTAAYEQDILRQLPNEITGSLDKNKWFNFFTAIGPTISLPEGKVVLDLRLLVGLTYTKSPTFDFNGTSNNLPIRIYQAKTYGFAPTLIIGASMSYPIVAVDYDLRLFAKGELIASGSRLKTSQIISSDEYNINNNRNYRQATGIFALTVGVRYEFGYAKQKK
ncbi:MAG: hypothetical protein ACPG5B_17850 [Chitinophagales bacterium]